jgi:phage-related protein
MHNLTQHVLYPGDFDKWMGDPDKSITGSGFSVPRGVEAVLSFNGLVMNDLSVYDKYRVMNIDGLADPDIRDSREDKPSDDGEDTYDSYYGGRTIVIKLRIEAYQLDKLRDMEEALRSVFADMKEKPLYFLTGDSEKDHYIMCKKNQSLTKDEDVQSMGYRFFRDWQITLRASDPRFYRVKKKQSVSGINSVQEQYNQYSDFEDDIDYNEHYLIDIGNTPNSSSAISSGWNGESKIGNKSLSFDLAPQSGMWVWYQDETIMRPQQSYIISFDYKTLFGGTLTPLTFYNRFSLYTAISDSSNNLLSAYSDNIPIYGSTEGTGIRSFIAPNNAHTISILIFYSYRANDPSLPEEHLQLFLDNIEIKNANIYSTSETLNIVNIGNYSSYPLIKLAGPMENISIHNDQAPAPFNRIRFKNTFEIDDGDIITIDVNNKKIIGPSGQNLISQLDKTSGWLKIMPGNNAIYLGAQTVLTPETDPKLIVEWRDSWV